MESDPEEGRYFAAAEGEKKRDEGECDGFMGRGHVASAAKRRS